MFEEKIKELNQMLENKQESFDKRTYTVDEIQDILEIGRTSAYSLVKRLQSGETRFIPFRSHRRLYPNF